MLIEFNGKRPKIAENVFIAPNATIIGDVIIEEGASVWFGAVVRGDSGQIRIGSGTSVQDNVVLHVNGRFDTIIGKNVVIGHAAVLEGCVIGDGVLIGMNATVLEGAKVGDLSAIAAGAVVREHADIPSGVLAAGVPAKVRADLSDDIKARIARAPDNYRKASAAYLQTMKIID
ncbi:MAG: carbonic anhydrase/acetyltransferase-like protein (isoleucine patch superfamily) [Candidatus Promineifilaceae bacterium]|jgi:carbonic anhydrase/acetyltransferase-like protein (isoleucine patch superfamily)